MLKSLDEMKKVKPVSWMKMGIYAIVIIFLYGSALSRMVLIDWAREDNSHCYLIPFIVLYLLWEKREVLSSYPSSFSWKGAVPLGLGIGLFWVGEFAGEFFTLYISLWFVIVGLTWLHHGWRKVREIKFALFMILTMFPLPNFINTKILVYLRIISSDLGVKMLHLWGMAVYREGNVIELPFTSLQVVDACSGLRFVVSLGILSLIMAYWFRGPLWKKAILVFSSVPLAIFTNSIRIAVTGILYMFCGARIAEGFFHGFSGWLIFMVTIPVLLLEMWILAKINRKDEHFTEPVTKEKPPQSSAVEKMAERPHPSKSPLLQPVFIAAIVLLVMTYAISRGIEFREKIPLKKSFNEFPLTVGDWTGKRQAMEQIFVDILHFSDYIMVGYQNAKGTQINFYVAYYESQRKGATTHSPETCFPGSGWTFEKSSLVNIAYGSDKKMKVNRTLVEKSGSRQLMYFWFPQRGRILTSLTQVKIYSFWDALTRKRTDGALVRITTPVYKTERMEEADQRLQSFTREIAPSLEEFIPQ